MTARVKAKPPESQYRKGQLVKRAACADIPSAVRRLVMRRDQYRCQRCGRQALHVPHSLNHRDARSQGGLHDPANLIFLCGSGSTGCHGQIEESPEEAYQFGFKLRRGCDPASHPVLRFMDRWEQPTADGWVPAPAPDSAVA
ncbi:MAG: HNH endonuclease [Gammaproteobacteria bacterium]